MWNWFLRLNYLDMLLFSPLSIPYKKIFLANYVLSLCLLLKYSRSLHSSTEKYPKIFQNCTMHVVLWVNLHHPNPKINFALFKSTGTLCKEKEHILIPKYLNLVSYSKIMHALVWNRYLVKIFWNPTVLFVMFTWFILIYYCSKLEHCTTSTNLFPEPLQNSISCTKYRGNSLSETRFKYVYRLKIKII